MNTNGTTNNTATGRNNTDVMVVYSVIYIVIMAESMLLIAAIWSMKKLRTKSNILILHLAVCDILRATFGIPFNLVHSGIGYFPYGVVGCKLIYPFATLYTNAIVLTFVCIAIERYFAVSSFNFHFSVSHIFASIVVIHFLAFVSVIPLSIFLHYGTDPVPQCIERWPTSTAGKSYIFFLFLIQYGIPLPVMIVFYTLMWLRIRKQNKRMIAMSEEYEKKMNWDDNECDAEYDRRQGIDSRNNNVEYSRQTKVTFTKRKSMQLMRRESEVETIKSEMYHDRKRHSLYETILKNDTVITLKRKMQYLTRRKSFMSVTAYLRHKQTVNTFKMFITVVAVFAICSLPNQILWISIDIFQKRPHEEVRKILSYLSFTNAVLNCWIYGGFNKTFRKAYRQILLTVITCGRINATPFYEAPNTATHVTDLDESVRERSSSTRQRKFSEMFRDHVNNFDKYRHLYKLSEDKQEEDEEEKESNAIKKAIDKRKKSIANFFGNVLQNNSSKNSTSGETGFSPRASRKIFGLIKQNSSDSVASPSLKTKDSERKHSTPTSPNTRRKSTASNASKRKMTMIPPVIPFTVAAGNATGTGSLVKDVLRKASQSSNPTRHSRDDLRRHSTDNTSQREKKRQWRKSYSPRNSRIFSEPQEQCGTQNHQSMHLSSPQFASTINEQSTPRTIRKKLSEDLKFQQTVRRNPSVAIVKKKHIVEKNIERFEKSFLDNTQNNGEKNENFSPQHSLKCTPANCNLDRKKNYIDYNETSNLLPENSKDNNEFTPNGHARVRRCATLDRPSITDLVGEDFDKTIEKESSNSENQVNVSDQFAPFESEKHFDIWETETKRNETERNAYEVKPGAFANKKEVLYIEDWDELDKTYDKLQKRMSTYKVIKNGEIHTVL